MGSNTSSRVPSGRCGPCRVRRSARSSDCSRGWKSSLSRSRFVSGSARAERERSSRTDRFGGRNVKWLRAPRVFEELYRRGVWRAIFGCASSGTDVLARPSPNSRRRAGSCGMSLRRCAAMCLLRCRGDETALGSTLDLVRPGFSRVRKVVGVQSDDLGIDAVASVAGIDVRGPPGVVSSPFAVGMRPRRARVGLLRRAAGLTCRAAHWHRLRSAPMYARRVLLLGSRASARDVRLFGDGERKPVPLIARGRGVRLAGCGLRCERGV